MATDVTERNTERPATGARQALTAANALRALGVLSFIGVLAAWWLGNLTGKSSPEVGRELFGNIPGALQALFYVSMATFLAVMFFLFAERAESWQQGSAERRTGLWGLRVRQLDRGLRMQTLLRDRAAGLMHAAIYYGFLVLFLGTVTLEIDNLVPTQLKFLSGGFYQGYSAVLDAASLVFLGGLAWAIVRRYGTRPWRIKSKTKPEDGWILGLLVVIGVTGLLTEAARIALEGRPDFEVWSFVGYPLSALLPASSGLHQFFWIAHAVAFVGFLVMLPTTKLRHMVTSPANMFLSPKDRPKGAMKPLPNLLETELESFGAAVVSDFTWKQIFDTDACTICGRCTSVCPANLTGKPLDPREMVLKVGEVAASTAGVSAPVSLADGVSISSDSVFERVQSEELWSCTTCGACDAICPVNIEILDRILDMRRYKSLMEADFPAELGKAYVALENQGNPWGLSQQNRADWTSGLDFDVPILGENVEAAEYLMWVGCAGSFDDRNQAVTQALATLLHEAGVDFAILGQKEACTGDPARRSGNEYVFQMLAMQNIETLDGNGVTKIVTQCAHCFNALGNEYPQYGGQYEVIHHSQLLQQLIVDKALHVAEANGKKITYHDPCYLGRHNDVYMAPRRVIAEASGGTLTEMPRHGTQSFCCGAGGARFWMEEHTGKKVNVERAEEALATGAETVAVACPYCYVMVDDALKELGRDDVVVEDIAIVLNAALKAGREPADS